MTNLEKHKKNRQTATFIRGAREKLRLTQQQLADYVGIERYNVAKYETGSTTPPGDVILKVYRLVENGIPDHR